MQLRQNPAEFSAAIFLMKPHDFFTRSVPNLFPFPNPFPTSTIIRLNAAPCEQVVLMVLVMVPWAQGLGLSFASIYITITMAKQFTALSSSWNFLLCSHIHGTPSFDSETYCWPAPTANQKWGKVCFFKLSLPPMGSIHVTMRETWN